MISEQSSEIVTDLRQNTTPAGEPVEMLIFGNALTLVVSSRAMALYRGPEYFGDPLGNGLIASIDLPGEGTLREEGGRLIADIQSGCVRLLDRKILLILPNEAKLYPDAESALHNVGALASLPLAED